jgi:hypothetical protein
MPNLIERVGSRAAEAIEKFREAAREFTAQYEWLRENPPAYVEHPDVWREYEGLMRRAKIAGTTMAAVTSTIDAVVGTVWRATGQDLAGVVRGNALGALPLIPIALVAGATATLLAIVRDVRNYRDRLRVYNELRGDGVQSDEAWQRAKEATQRGFFGMDMGALTRPLMWLGGGALALWFINRIR